MKKNKSLTIGIPAFNEEANIKNLLLDILSQRKRGFDLKQIIIVSDGSRDKTVLEARSVNDKRIILIVNNARRGVNQAQNQIIRRSKTDILVLINADVLPKNKFFLTELIKPILRDRKIGIVGANTISLPARTIIERILANSHEFKQFLYRRINDSDNVYLCHGRARAFPKEFYSQIIWPDNCPEDPYSYYFCKQKGFKFVFAPMASVFFRSPNNLQEHIVQSTRFISGQKKLEEFFPKEYIAEQFKLPSLFLLKAIILYLFKNPFSTPAYLLINLYIRLFKKEKPNHFSRYKISPTSKKIIYET